MILENWSVTGSLGQYDPPELQHCRLQGEVFGHSRFNDGARVTTSVIQKVDGCLVVTQGGGQYFLGEPLEEYVKWCREQGCHVPTSLVPIKLI